MLFSLMTSTSLPKLLRYEDRNAMRFQIESRTPFADDREMIEEVFAIPSVYKIHDGYSKWLLRESMKPILPEKIYQRQDKIGFATPENAWLRPQSECFRSLMDDSLSEYLDVARIRREWNTLMDRQPKRGVLPLWRLVNVAMWVKK
jgi:asparagine synthase (glutamine-hydrolysing)